jgi:putative sterol carrier protein
MTALELLRRLPEVYQGDPDDQDVIVQYAISTPVHHVLRGGSLETREGAAEAPDVTILISDDNLVKLMRGELNPMSAFMTGKLKVKGDLMLAQRLVSRVDRDALRRLG